MPEKPNNPLSFWQELKRRKVVRVITVYAAAAWVILEFISNIEEPFGLPNWTTKLVFVILCVGLIISIILSWIYDFTPEGIEKTKPVHEVSEEDKPVTSKGWKIASYVSFVVIVALIVLNIIPRTNPSGKRVNLEKSIAVIPFINDSPDEENAYFINGIMDELIINLQSIQDLRVPGRTSVEQYRNNPKPIPEIAKDLGVNYIVEASGQKYGNEFTLRVQLLEGTEGMHLWGETIDHRIESVEGLSSIQSGIALSIADKLKAIITPEEKLLIEKIPTTSLTAYDFFQRGRAEHEKYLLDRKNIEALKQAENFYYKALEHDSTFAQAYTGLALVYWHKYIWNEILDENFMDSVLILTDIALSFDDQLSEAYVIRGDYHGRLNQKRKAINEYDKAIKINPNDWLAYMQRGFLHNYYDLVKTLDDLHKAASLHRGPFLPEILLRLEFTYSNAGFNERARHYAKEIFKLDEDSATYYDALAFLEESIGDYEKAIEYDEIAYAIDSTRYWVLNHLGLYHSYLNESEESLRYWKEYDRRYKVLSETNPLNKFRIGYAYWVNGFKEEAQYYFNSGFEYYNKMSEMDRRTSSFVGPYYALATAYAFLGDKEKAFENLRLYYRESVKQLFMVSLIKIDPMLNSLRDEPEFLQIVKKLEADYEAEHERVRQWLEENDLL